MKKKEERSLLARLDKFKPRENKKSVSGKCSLGSAFWLHLMVNGRRSNPANLPGSNKLPSLNLDYLSLKGDLGWKVVSQ